MPDATEPSPVLPGEPRRERKPESTSAVITPGLSPLLVPEREHHAETMDFGMVAGLIGLILIGPTVLISQVPYGRIVALIMAVIGLLLGLASLGAEGRAKLTGSVAAALHSLIIVVLLLLPSWLNLGPWLTPRFESDEPTGPQAVGHGTQTAAPADWVDASTASWRYRDASVTVRSATVGPVDLVGPKAAKRTSKQEYLRLTLRITHEGTEQPIELSGWASGEANHARLTDASGQALKPATLDRGWELAGESKPTVLFPGKVAEIVLVFEAPPKRAEFYRLTLPGESIGLIESVRFRIPGSFVTSRRTP
jgi:hypothetical protein